MASHRLISREAIDTSNPDGFCACFSNVIAATLDMKKANGQDHSEDTRENVERTEVMHTSFSLDDLSEICCLCRSCQEVVCHL